MTTKTEGQHKGEFIVQAVDAERGDWYVEAVTYKSGTDVADGTVIKLSSGEAVAISGTVDTAGDSNEDIIGIALGNYDTSTGAKAGVYVARGCVVNVDLLTIPGSNDAAVIAALAALGIIAR